MVSEYLAQQANAESREDVFLTLLTISHSTLATPIRCVLNDEDVISRGATYTAYPFDFTPAELSKDGAKPARISIGNIDGRIITLLRTVAGSGEEPVMTFEFVFASSPDDVERSFPLFILQNARYDDAIEGDLVLPDLSIEPIPGYSFTPNWAPGLVYG